MLRNIFGRADKTTQLLRFMKLFFGFSGSWPMTTKTLLFPFFSDREHHTMAFEKMKSALKREEARKMQSVRKYRKERFHVSNWEDCWSDVSEITGELDWSEGFHGDYFGGTWKASWELTDLWQSPLTVSALSRVVYHFCSLLRRSSWWKVCFTL